MIIVNGYKCFNEGLITRYNDKLEVGKVYHADGAIKFNKSGFHMCLNLEDTLRYFDAFKSEINIANVTGFGNIFEYNDEYNGFYDMYSVEYIRINSILTREDIIKYALKLPAYRAKRFISLYKLTDVEIELFKNIFINEIDVIDAINYYQDCNSQIYIKKKK